LKEESFVEIVRQVWNDPQHLLTVGAQRHLVGKLSLLKERIKVWVREKRQKDQSDLLKIEEAIEFEYNQVNLGLSSMEDSIKLSKLESERNHFLMVEEESWRQKSQAIWIKSGDKNTKFFHHYASYRRNKKFIWEIKDEAGKVHLGQQAIKDEAVRHFRSFFNDTGQINMEERIESVRLFLTFVNAVDVQNLEKEVSKDEIFEVIKGFSRDKSPGPDGWTTEFYHFFFDLVGQDLVDMVEETRLRGRSSLRSIPPLWL
jgi:hypothetical protein